MCPFDCVSVCVDGVTAEAGGMAGALTASGARRLRVTTADVQEKKKKIPVSFRRALGEAVQINFMTTLILSG